MGLSELCQSSVKAPYCKDWEPRYPQNTSQRLPSQNYHLDTPRCPPQRPPYTPKRSPEDTRRQQTTTDANRHRHMYSNSTCQCLRVSGAVCLCLVASVFVCLHLLLPGDVWWVSGICLVFFWGVSEWYLCKSEALGCVWRYLGSQSLQYRAVTLFCHNPEIKE